MNPSTPASDPSRPAPPTSFTRRNGRRAWFVVRLVLLLAAILAAVWWFRFAPVVAAAHTVATGTILAEVMGTGTLEARTSASVGPKIGGLIVSVAADQGDRVKAGDLLFRLEDGDVRQQVAIAESEVATATAALDKLDAGRRKAEAVLAQARSNHTRVERLIASEVASEQDLEKAVETVSVAEAELALAEAAIREGRKHLATAERGLEYQRARLDDTTIESPFDALVVRRDRQVGDVVVQGSSVFQVVSTDEMWISAWVDEAELDRGAPGQTARGVFRSLPDTGFPGAVARIGREADRETREIVVDVRVDSLPPNWALGQRAEVRIQVERRDAVTILPGGLVLVVDGKPGVMLDIASKARWRPVVVGLRGIEDVEITAGLLAGDVVVFPAEPGAGPLREGRNIRLR